MKFDIKFEKVFPHPPDRVWGAISNRDSLGKWLMETDFTPEPGREFRMWCENDEGGTDTYHCKVIELDPPDRMLWSWVLEGGKQEGEMYVEFILEEIQAGTRLIIRHTGDLDPGEIERFKGGWPVKLDSLMEAIK